MVGKGGKAAGGFGRRGEKKEWGDAAASGPNPPAPHHYWSKEVGKQKRGLGVGGGGWMDGWRPKETHRESRGGAEKRRWRLFAEEPRSHRAIFPFPTQASELAGRRRTATVLTGLPPKRSNNFFGCCGWVVGREEMGERNV
jgi:hypothetical protein